MTTTTIYIPIITYSHCLYELGDVHINKKEALHNLIVDKKLLNTTAFIVNHEKYRRDYVNCSRYNLDSEDEFHCSLLNFNIDSIDDYKEMIISICYYDQDSNAINIERLQKFCET